MSSPVWLFLSVRLLAMMALGVALGAMFRAPWIGVVVVLALYLALHLTDLLRVLRWLRRDEPELAPELAGPWGELVAMIIRLYRR